MSNGTDSSVTSLRLPIYAIKNVSALAAVVHKRRLHLHAIHCRPVNPPALGSCSVCGASFTEARDHRSVTRAQAAMCHVCRRHAPAARKGARPCAGVQSASAIRVSARVGRPTRVVQRCGGCAGPPSAQGGCRGISESCGPQRSRSAGCKRGSVGRRLEGVDGPAGRFGRPRTGSHRRIRRHAWFPGTRRTRCSTGSMPDPACGIHDVPGDPRLSSHSS